MSARRVALNALYLDPGVSGGTETYLRGLVPALAAVRPAAELTVVTTRRGGAALHADGWSAWARIVVLRCDEGQRVRRQTAEQVALGRVARAHGAQVVHSLANVGPVHLAGPRHVLTLHDVNFVHHQTFGAVTTLGLRAVVPRAARGAARLITGTAVARDDVCATLGLDPARFTVVHHGIDGRPPVVPTPQEDLRVRLGVPPGARILLTIGAKRPHKNQGALIEALDRLPADVHLVLAGHPEDYDAVLRRLAADRGVADRVHFPDYVSDADLAALWGMAAVAAFPTRAEGFGLPLAEALARGVPVACSDLPVLREVGGPFPRYFDPDRPDEIAVAIGDLLADPPDAAPATAWAAQFTWAAAAAATWDVYDRAVRS